MKTLLVPILMMSAVATAQLPDVQAQINIAVQVLPEAKRADATVLGYNENQAVITLREGTNEFTCLTDDPFKEGFNAACYHNSLNPFMQRGRELRAEGKTNTEIFSIREEEAKAGKLQMPDKPATLYVLYGKEAAYNPQTGLVENTQSRWVVYIPWATPESSGLPTGPMVDGGPWIMFPSTHAAHIMITPPQ